MIINYYVLFMMNLATPILFLLNQTMQFFIYGWSNLKSLTTRNPKTTYFDVKCYHF